MRQWGTYMMTVGIGAFILPMFGLQFRVMNAFGESLPLVATGTAIAGVALLGMSYWRAD
jgi:hypothetical protein